MIVAHFGLMATPWIGALMVLGALGLTTAAQWLEHKEGNMPITGAGALSQFTKRMRRICRRSNKKGNSPIRGRHTIGLARQVDAPGQNNQKETR